MSISEYAAGFEYSETERGISSTRVYHLDTTSESSTVTGATIPRPGDIFVPPAPIDAAFGFTGRDMSALICRQKSVKCLAGHPNKFEITVMYSNEPVDKNIFSDPASTSPATDITKLPTTLEFGGETVTINPVSSDGWTWTDSGNPVVQPIGFRVNSSTLRIKRYVSDTKYADFQKAVRITSGCVNQTDDPFGTKIGGKAGCWLFKGCTSSMINNVFNLAFWECELEFAYRDPDQSNAADGWQKTLRLDGVWDKPKDKDGYYRYEAIEFTGLFK